MWQMEEAQGVLALHKLILHLASRIPLANKLQQGVALMGTQEPQASNANCSTCKGYLPIKMTKLHEFRQFIDHLQIALVF
jgi:hypothetical protein